MNRLCRICVVTSLVCGCADFERLAADVCGNSVVEPNAAEDCDGITDPSFGEDLVCGPADGSAQQCRYICDGAECPEGWTCEDDGICRAPSGTFEFDEDPVLILRADELLLADLVEDSQAELVARAGGDVSIFSLDDEGFRRDSELSLLNTRGRLAAADLDLDDNLDLLLPASASFDDADAPGRLHALRHGPERLQTVVAPQRPVGELGGVGADVIRQVVAVQPVAASPAEVAVVVGERDGEFVAFAPEPSCPSLPDSAVARVGLSMDRILTRPATRAATTDAPAMVALTLRDDPVAVIINAERRCGQGECSIDLGGGTQCVTTPFLSTVVAFDGSIVDAGCSFWDSDADGDDDLVCNLADDRVAAAPLEGADFLPSVDLTPQLVGRLDLPEGQSRMCRSAHDILAAADLDGDGRVDIVTPHGVFLVDDDGARRIYARVRGDAWDEAVVGDFDGDGELEVVASVRELANGCLPTQLEHLVPTLGSFSSALVPNAPPAVAVRVNDLDGDGLADVAVNSFTNEGEARIVAFFGDTKEPLEDRVEVGDYGTVDTIASVRSREGTDVNEDLIGDLAIVSEGGTQWTLFTGTSDRSLLAPLPLDPRDGPPLGDSSIAVLGGVLLPRPPADGDDDESAPPDVLALAEGHVWLYRDEDVRTGEDVVHLSGDAVPAPLQALRMDCARWSLLERGADGAVIAGIDGVAALGPDDDVCDDDVAPTVAIATFVDGAEVPTLRSRAFVLDDALRQPTSLQLFDFGPPGDTPDLLVLGSRASVPTALLAQDISSTDTGGVATVTLLEGRAVWAAAAINADRDAELEIALVTADGLAIVDSPGPEFGDGEDVTFTVSSIPLTISSPQSVQLVAGLLDGDDLTDLALLNDNALFLLPAIAVD